MNVTILYYTKTGHTLEAATAVAEGIRSAGSEAELVPIEDAVLESLADSAGLIVASPCWAGSITPSGVARPVAEVLDSLPPDCLSGKRCGGVAVHSTTGGKRTVKTLGRRLADKGCTDYRAGPAAKAGSALSLWKGPSVQPDDEERFRAYGADFVA
ncbi:MAG: hypothetical protein HN742_03290 [Lentisphaerae bacterium]|jgi:flavorubredoxin|nr:hypothetical protein [Lentisphaerota bacterium]MBT4821853.1 hypothetical protein [Lentisphaerota bacterium]MBT5605494.1 hypothetical protein [Lentisphaerota bacterium]MBT7060075.1 hypothetical protein [Lentisphaerota bacterium]MBT7840865.1 hypothetical protein [Lentisphaerota bacterium]